MTATTWVPLTAALAGAATAAATPPAEAVDNSARARLRATRASNMRLDNSVRPPEDVLRVRTHSGRWITEQARTSAVQASLARKEPHARVVRPEDRFASRSRPPGSASSWPDASWSGPPAGRI